MREHLYRAKRLDNKEWVYGGSIIKFNDTGEGVSYYMPSNTEKCIATHEDDTDNIVGFEQCTFYKVDSETAGEYTGLTDKNGTKIFDGDLLKDKYQRITYVCWHDGGFARRYLQDGIDGRAYRFVVCQGVMDDDDAEVIGNIHDNPELMEV